MGRRRVIHNTHTLKVDVTLSHSRRVQLMVSGVAPIILIRPPTSSHIAPQRTRAGDSTLIVLGNGWIKERRTKRHRTPRSACELRVIAADACCFVKTALTTSFSRLNLPQLKIFSKREA